MFGWVLRILLVIAGFIASWFVARDALNFATVQMIIAVILFALMVIIAAFWSVIKRQINVLLQKRKK